MFGFADRSLGATTRVRLTGEHLVPMEIRPALLDLDLPLWNSEEDLAEARLNKFIVLKFK